MEYKTLPLERFLYCHNPYLIWFPLAWTIASTQHRMTWQKFKMSSSRQLQCPHHWKTYLLHAVHGKMIYHIWIFHFLLYLVTRETFSNSYIFSMLNIPLSSFLHYCFLCSFKQLDYCHWILQSSLYLEFFFVPASLQTHFFAWECSLILFSSLNAIVVLFCIIP